MIQSIERWGLSLTGKSVESYFSLIRAKTVTFPGSMSSVFKILDESIEGSAFPDGASPRGEQDSGKLWNFDLRTLLMLFKQLNDYFS